MEKHRSTIWKRIMTLALAVLMILTSLPGTNVMQVKAAPVITVDAPDTILAKGKTITLSVAYAPGVKYQWFGATNSAGLNEMAMKDGSSIAGATTHQLTLTCPSEPSKDSVMYIRCEMKTTTKPITTYKSETVKINVYKHRKISITGGSAQVSGVSVTNAIPGDVVTIESNKYLMGSPLCFSHWDVQTEGVILDDPFKATTTFVMPARDVEITCKSKEKGTFDINAKATPISVVKSAGETVSFTADIAEATLANYQWYIKIDDGEFQKIEDDSEGYFVGSQTATLTYNIPVDDMNQIYPDRTHIFVCEVTSMLDDTKKAKTNEVVLKTRTKRDVLKTNVSATIGGTEITEAYEGQKITIKPATIPEGQAFISWEVSAGVELEDEEAEETSFIMPGAPVSIKAIVDHKWVDNHDNIYHWEECEVGSCSEIKPGSKELHVTSDYRYCDTCGFDMGSIPNNEVYEFDYAIPEDKAIPCNEIYPYWSDEVVPCIWYRKSDGHEMTQEDRFEVGQIYILHATFDKPGVEKPFLACRKLYEYSDFYNLMNDNIEINLELTAISHDVCTYDPGEPMLYDEFEHWRVCEICGEVYGGKSLHRDADNDGICDQCSSPMPDESKLYIVDVQIPYEGSEPYFEQSNSYEGVEVGLCWGYDDLHIHEYAANDAFVQLMGESSFETFTAGKTKIDTFAKYREYDLEVVVKTDDPTKLVRIDGTLYKLVASPKPGVYVLDSGISRTSLPHTHTYDQKTVTAAALKTPADCENAAVYYKSCECHMINKADDAETFEDGLPLGHDWDEGVITKESTEEETGIKTYTCKRNSSHTKTDVLDKLSKTPDKEDKDPVPPAAGQIYSDKTAQFAVTSKNDTTGTMTYQVSKESSATEINVPDTIKVGTVTYKVTEIADNAFKNNKKLKKIKIGSNIKVIGKNAFYGCKNLKSVTGGKNVVTIKDKAFYNCSSLTKITLNNKVNKLGASTFYGCKKLKTVTIKTTKLTSKKVGKNAFKKLPANASMKVPKSKLKAYKKFMKSKGFNGKVK